MRALEQTAEAGTNMLFNFEHTSAMCSSERSRRPIAVCVCLLTIICHTATCNYTVSYEPAATHPATHRARRYTTSTPHVDHWRNAVTADDTFLDTAQSEQPVFTTAAENDALSLAGRQVPGHVTSLPTFESPGHVTRTTNDSAGSSETGGSFRIPRQPRANDHVVITSSHGVLSNAVSRRPLVTSRLRKTSTAQVSEDTSPWESWITSDEPETQQYTTHSSGDGLLDQPITSSVTSSDRTQRAPMDRGELSSKDGAAETVYGQATLRCLGYSTVGMWWTGVGSSVEMWSGTGVRTSVEF